MMRLRRSISAACGALCLALLATGAAQADSTGADSTLADSTTPNPGAPITVALPQGLAPRTVGFYMAQDKGYYAAAGVKVTFVTPDGDADPADLLLQGKADLALALMPPVLKRREGGDRVTHVAQIFRNAGLELVCRPGIDTPAALKNHVVGVWFGGLESSFYAWMAALDLNPFGGPGSVTVLRQNFGLEAFQRFQTDCATTFTYTAPLEFAAAGINLSEMKQYRYQEANAATLEDGLYARDDDLAKPDRVALFAAFLSAARRGWQTAHLSPRAAFDLVHADPAFAKVDVAALHAAVDAVDELVVPEKIGRLDPAAYDRTVNLLLTAAPDPVLTRAPAGAVSDVVWQKAK
jgi:NitT/TauT family transport system substrate-binding protein